MTTVIPDLRVFKMFSYLLLPLFFFGVKGQVGQPCDEYSCQFGGVCSTEAETPNQCVCPDLPCPKSEKNMKMCSTDDVTYLNLCALQMTMCREQREIDIKHMGECGVQHCKTRWDCQFGGNCIMGECVCIECRDVYDRKVYYNDDNNNFPGASMAWKKTSICGSDGITYESECHLEYFACMAKRLVFMMRKGPCTHEKHSRSNSTDLVQIKPTVEVVQRSVVSKPVANCSILVFSQCVSRFHPRIRYMGEYTMMSDVTSFGSPVYKLSKEGHVDGDQKDSFRRMSKRVPVYLYRYVSDRHPKGAWIVGSETDNGKGWLGSKDSAKIPENIVNIWKSTKKRNPKKWKKEPSLSLNCLTKPNSIYECSESYTFKGERDSNWQPVVPATPYYQLEVTQRTRRRKRRKTVRTITVIVLARRKTRRFVSYMLKMSTNRLACGFPTLSGTKSKERHVEHCDGSVLIRKGTKKKLMKSKIRFKAPQYGCVDFRAAVVSSQGLIYEDDNLVKRVCADEV